MAQNVHLEGLFEDIKRKWNLGLEHFHSLRKGKVKENIYVKTALYGDIEFGKDDRVEKIFLDSFLLQRLKYISHLTFGYHAYPEARHSRFEHSLGTYFLAKLVLLNLVKKRKINKTTARNLILAALLHDVGQGPFSHIMDMVLAWPKYRDNRNPEGIKYHEKKGRDIILTNSKKNDLVLESLNIKNPEIADFLRSEGLKDSLMAKSITGESDEPASKIINGTVDADKLDYLLRDSYTTGVPYGIIDYSRLTRMFDIGTDESRLGKKSLGLDSRAFLAFIHLLISREISYSTIAFHHASTVCSSMLHIAVEVALELLNDTKEEFLNHFELMEDADLICALEIISSSRCFPPDSKQEILRKIIRNLRYRKLYKRFLHLKFCNFERKKLFGKLIKLSKRTLYFSGKEISNIIPKIGKLLTKSKDVLILNVQEISEFERLKLKVIKNGKAIEVKEFTDFFLGGKKPYIRKLFGITETDYEHILQRIKFDSWSLYLLGPEEMKEKWSEEWKKKEEENLEKLLSLAISKF